VRWAGRIHLAKLPEGISRISFTILSDAKEIQFGRITKSGLRDRWVARPPLLPSIKCTPLQLPDSSDPRDHMSCPQACQPVKYLEPELAHMSHQVSNIDNTPTLWLTKDPVGNNTCDRWIGDQDYVDFELNYTSSGVWPHIELKWTGDGLPYQTVDGSYFYQSAHMSFLDHLIVFDVNPKTATVIGVCLLLACMWFVGEVLFHTKRARDSVNSKEEKAEIEGINAKKERSYVQDRPEGPDGILMATRDAEDYPVEWVRAVSKWKLRNKKHSEVNDTSAVLRGMLMYLGFFIMGNAVVGLFLCIAPPPPSETETHDDLRTWSFYLQPFGDTSRYGAYDFICFGALMLENLLFLWAILEVEWPTRGSKNTALDVLSKEEMDVMNPEGQQVALLIACHCCDQSLDKRNGLQAALKAALDVFPPSSIFICDNARSDAPPDETWRLIDDVWHEYRNESNSSSRAQEPLNYVYLPVGNKTIAFFWCCDVWIPMLERNKLCPKFEYILMTDDDVCLPPTIQFPTKMMEMEKDVQAIAYAISAIDLTKAVDNPRLYNEVPGDATSYHRLLRS